MWVANHLVHELDGEGNVITLPPVPSVLTNNYIENPATRGIRVNGGNHLVQNNTIVCNGAIAGIELHEESYGLAQFFEADPTAAYNNEIKGNKISGSVEFGMVIGDLENQEPISDSPAYNNFIHGNNLTGLTTSSWLYIFGIRSCNNTIKGFTGGMNKLVYDENEPSCNSVSGVK
jgi:hypothetical protein